MRFFVVHVTNFQVNEVLEQALDEILSQGRSEDDNEVEMGPGAAAAATMSDSEAEEAERLQRDAMDGEDRDEDDGMHDYIFSTQSLVR